MRRSYILTAIIFFICPFVYGQPQGISDLTGLMTLTEGRVTLSWTSPDPADGASAPSSYLVKYATAGINNADFYSAWVSTYAQNWTTLVSSGQAETRTLTGLTPGATLYFAAVAINGTSEYGVWSSSTDTSGAANTAAFAVVFDTAPERVEGVGADALDNMADVAWTANSEGDIALYEVESSSYSVAEGFVLLASILPGGTTHQAGGLVNGNTYYFRVRAKDATGHYGAYSVAADTVPWAALGVPAFSSDTLAFSSTTLRWAWTEAANAGGYRVISSTSGDCVSGDLSSGTTFWYGGALSPNTSAAMTVQAFNGVLTANSAENIMFTLCNPPTGFTAVPGTTKIDITWSPNGNASHTRYSLQRSSDSFSTFSLRVDKVASVTFQDTGLSEGATYQYRVWATNNDNLPSVPQLGTDKIEFSTVTVRIAPEAPPINGTFSYPGTNDGEAVLTWQAAYDDNGDATSGRAAAYVIAWATFTVNETNFFSIGTSSTVAASVNPPSSESKVMTNLYPGTTFCFAIKSRDRADNYSLIYDTMMISAQDKAPQSPTAVTALSLSSSSVHIAWTLPSFTGYDDRDRYKIYRATFVFSSFQSNVSTFSVAHLAPSSTYYTDTGLAAETSYYYTISCLDKGDDAGAGYSSFVIESALPAVVMARTPDTTPPAPVTAISASPGNTEGKILLSWSAPGDDGEGGALSNGTFRIAYSTDPNQVFSVNSYNIEIATAATPAQAQNRIVTGLSGGSTYYIRLWTADEAGNWSSVSAGATSWAQVDVTAPSQITSFSAVSSWRRAVLSWTAPGDDDASGTLNGAYELRLSSVSAINDTTGWNAVSTGYPYRIAWSTVTTPGACHSHAVTGLTNNVTYYFSIVSYDDNGNWSGVSSTSPAAVPLNIAPGAFALSSPADSAISPTATPAFAWAAASDSDGSYGDIVTYTISYSTDSGFGVATSVAALSSPSYTPGSALEEDKTYYWRVNAIDSDGRSTSSTPSSNSLRINVVNTPPASFNLGTPESAGTVYTATPLLSWDSSSDVDPGDVLSYRVDYSPYADFSSYSSAAGIGGTSYTAPALTENAVYWWRVWATDGALLTMSATTNYFSVNASSEAPNSFNLVSPQNDTRQTNLTVTFTWEETTAPDPGDSVTYDLIYSLSPEFSFSTTVTGLTQPTTSVALAWGDNYYYYWKVEAVSVKNGLERASTQIRKFYTDIEKQTPASFSLTEPAYGVLISTTVRPWFIWEEALDPDPADIVRYYIDVSPNADFTGSQPIPTGTDMFYQPLSNLLDQTTYYWRVRAAGFQGNPPVTVDPEFVFSPTGVFVISMVNNAPQSFNLISPAATASVATKTPVLEWQEAADTDLNEVITYDIFIATVSDFSVIVDSSAGLTARSYTPGRRLAENKTYYWKVVAQDRKGARTPSASVFTFTVPVLNRPVAPSGLTGKLSSDENSFTLQWSATLKNTDGSAIDDLAGYNVYRLLSISSLEAAVKMDFIAYESTAWTDASVRGGKFYFLLRAVDVSGLESANSLILDTLSPDQLTLVSADEEVVADVPPAASQELLAANNKWQKDLSLHISRRTEYEEGRILRSYDLDVRDSGLAAISGYTFAAPVTLQFSYETLSAAAPSAAGEALGAGDLGVYWYNGIEFIRVGGHVDESKKKVIIKATKPGQYQLRQINKVSAFGLASTYPAKIFTPGAAPFEKMYFYVDNPEGDKITGKVYDMRGELIADLAPLDDATGTSVVLAWDGKDASKGVYIYQIVSEKKVINGTVIIAK